MEFIPIEKDSIPYQFDIALGVDIFTFEVNYNERFDFFTLDLMKDDQVLLQGVKLVYGVPVFAGIEDHRFPVPLIVPVDEAGRETAVTWGNFGETVFLAYGEGEGEEDE
ncbi:hypothetical protein WJ0W_007039 [Paenibacillus melissococcoides]|uniref:Cyanophage baseplate Pam3 plug gp18 domain-containing protein n=1 Tax=Paenibacillus melissococcoides TaxID=2912268 RepID=A0ABM9GBA4_9BACL|nr:MULTISPECIES: hypothetical protein [Paenibacillus]MEB9894670.1 hypothetical protein [Bacillus cereus]CAH8248844.1 hypothetical protein WJ0W_006028 [Paenibacillus melissococcoides]CAH8249331.1 hypothetical protein WJ0W_006517 [Paenibacillus melissococcoides]CAH8249478.1 hypothetical protein WJ0W_006663 [Paenibacillus melissococcoides]CAH8249855.1 hypothetical protein WJ0W_007039 [Paenibacillus melissococcoides]